ncbi:hypothetical protein N5D61_16205 [Pseudomonas sp. GD03842]|uniref:DUF6861 domain-containing protein n=1 Tax=Pseudomonas sp. GD03842 TaxID=2975385 RepID=UPI002449BBBE|nr:hypothetical protein [Pseudomonas sp. GD03842]MDH0747879.1 hypothetical protein [Pseudomonas sp. GD03842]
MDLLAHVPSWDDIERNLDHRFSELNQSVSSGWQSAHDGWNGFTRRVSNGANRAYGAMGGTRIDNVRHAMALSYPIMQTNLSRKWASINISQILPVLIKLVQEVVMILGGSVAVGGAVGGAAGSLAFGIGAAPGAVAGAGIGLQVGNLILMALGLSAIAEYFYKGLPACLTSLQEGLATAWHAEDGLKPPGLDPTGGSSAQMQERTELAARQLARGQEQLVMLLLTAIVTYLTRGQMKAGVMNSMESIATRSAKLQAEISNRQFADWLAKNQSKILAEPELQVKEVAPLNKAEREPPLTNESVKSTKPPKTRPTFDEIYAKAAAAKAEIDAAADEIAARYGGTVAKAPIKSRARALEKIANDYGGDPTKIKDLARNTIIVPADKIASVTNELAQRGAKVKIIDGATDPLGYSGVNSSFMTKAGIPGEIQVNSPQMIFAKEPEALARNLLGNDTYDAVASKAGVPGGLGHSYYEDWRTMNPTSTGAEAIAKQSKVYYDTVRGL